MVGADLKSLRLAHDKAHLACFLVLQELDGASAPLLPLVAVLVEPVEFRLPAKPNPHKSDQHLIEPAQAIARTRDQKRGKRGHLTCRVEHPRPPRRW